MLTREQVGIDLDQLLSDDKSGVNMDNGARMVGCWNGLGKRGIAGVDFSGDPQPMQRAVAFSNTISQSRLFTAYFPPVIESCIAAAGNSADSTRNRLRCEVDHVDGSQNALIPLRAAGLAAAGTGRRRLQNPLQRPLPDRRH